MSYTVIILSIIAIALIYVLYVYFVKKSNVLSQSANLNGSNPPITTISSGNSTQYAYGIWVYVNTWNTAPKNIFSRPGNISLDLAADTPTLTCTIQQTPGPAKPIVITNNFPIQTWVYIIVSSSGTIVDFYINGKLVNSNKLLGSPTQPSSSSAITYGTGWDCYVAGFNNWSAPIGPQEAWDSYMSGHGSSVSQFFSQYGVNIAVTKDNVVQSSYSF